MKDEATPTGNYGRRKQMTADLKHTGRASQKPKPPAKKKSQAKLPPGK